MAFPMNSRPLSMSPISHNDDDTTIYFDLSYHPAGPESWTLFNEHSNDLRSVGMAFATQDWDHSIEAVAEPVSRSLCKLSPPIITSP